MCQLAICMVGPFSKWKGRPRSQESRAQSYEDSNASAQRKYAISPVPTKAEDDVESTRYRHEDDADRDEFTPVYYLEGHRYHPAAFEIVVNWLYHQNPDTPKTQDEYTTVMRAYLLALRYRIIELQDAGIDYMRQHHREFSARFVDLISWLESYCNRHDRA